MGAGGVPCTPGSFCFCLSLPHPRGAGLAAQGARPREVSLSADTRFGGALSKEKKGSWEAGARLWGREEGSDLVWL